MRIKFKRNQSAIPLTLIHGQFIGKQTKNLEIRWCDDLLEAYDRAERIRDRYYKNGE